MHLIVNAPFVHLLCLQLKCFCVKMPHIHFWHPHVKKQNKTKSTISQTLHYDQLCVVPATNAARTSGNWVTHYWDKCLFSFSNLPPSPKDTACMPWPHYCSCGCEKVVKTLCREEKKKFAIADLNKYSSTNISNKICRVELWNVCF